MTPAHRKVWLVSAVLLAATALALHFMGRSTWCACASYVPWSWEVFSRHNSQHLIDPYTPTHVLHGVIFYFFLWLVARKRLSLDARFLTAVTLESAWELLENSPMIIERYRKATISLDYYGDSVINSVSDIVACAAGFLLVSKLPVRASIALFVGVEIALALLIRDNLTLNVLMLLWPLAAVRRWQSGGS